MRNNVYPIRDGMYLCANLTQAAAPLMFGMISEFEDDCLDDCEHRVQFGNDRTVHVKFDFTPYQTSHARHNLSLAKKLVLRYAKYQGWL